MNPLSPSTTEGPPVDPLTDLSAARFGLYVHFPYCLSKCPYCDFASVAAKEVPQARYTRAIARELDLRVTVDPSLANRPVDSVYFGGGTPSLWEPERIETLLSLFHSRLRLTAGAEVTLEANPGAADIGRFAAFRRAGINRLSIGVQSFEPTTLAFLGREHDGASAERAARAGREAGFANLSLDFIYGVPGQDADSVVRDAERAVALEPEHLSAYALTLDRESLAEEVPLAKQLAKGEVRLPEDDVVLEMARRIRRVYAGAGLIRYEISNYARPGFHSRHNSLYWTGGEYLALGTGATGFLQNAGGSFRYTNHRSPDRYLHAVESALLPEAGREALGPGELFAERLAMGLRLTTGIDVAAVCRAFQQPFEPRERRLQQMAARGLAQADGLRWMLTDQGQDLHSAISAALI